MHCGERRCGADIFLCRKPIKDWMNPFKPIITRKCGDSDETWMCNKELNDESELLQFFREECCFTVPTFAPSPAPTPVPTPFPTRIDSSAYFREATPSGSCCQCPNPSVYGHCLCGTRPFLSNRIVGRQKTARNESKRCSDAEFATDDFCGLKPNNLERLYFEDYCCSPGVKTPWIKEQPAESPEFVCCNTQ
jgi:hypothetical protein